MTSGTTSSRTDEKRCGQWDIFIPEGRVKQHAWQLYSCKDHKLPHLPSVYTGIKRQHLSASQACNYYKATMYQSVYGNMI